MERICSKSCEFQEKQNKFEPSPCPGKNLELPRKAEALKTGILFSKEEKKRLKVSMSHILYRFYGINWQKPYSIDGLKDLVSEFKWEMPLL